MDEFVIDGIKCYSGVRILRQKQFRLCADHQYRPLLELFLKKILELLPATLISSNC